MCDLDLRLKDLQLAFDAIVRGHGRSVAVNVRFSLSFWKVSSSTNFSCFQAVGKLLCSFSESKPSTVQQDGGNGLHIETARLKSNDDISDPSFSPPLSLEGTPHHLDSLSSPKSHENRQAIKATVNTINGTYLKMHCEIFYMASLSMSSHCIQAFIFYM
jgi:hypothetical protein